jgi:aspartyl-tRNA(Asn)/glutamyl-tRNA(Gln) amidotransferase subunit B
LELSGDARATANAVVQSVLPALKEADCELEDSLLTASQLASLMALEKANRLTARGRRELLPELIEKGGDPEALMQERGLESVSDQGLIESAVAEVLAANPEAIEKYRAGDAKPLNFLMGQVMKRTRGKADPDTVRAILADKLQA